MSDLLDWLFGTPDGDDCGDDGGMWDDYPENMPADNDCWDD